MTYRLFIDDERFPPNDKNQWVICRSMNEVRETVLRDGMPAFISFDHDLGDNVPTGMDIAKWLIERDLDNLDHFTEDFSFYVHSQNVNGAQNIIGIMANYLAFKRQNT